MKNIELLREAIKEPSFDIHGITSQHTINMPMLIRAIVELAEELESLKSQFEDHKYPGEVFDAD